ncbi:hypothetical protein I79_010340 [Cricetulus griseus]|uniref:Uncharacterized protein n=1 Tax=Cricetulus griseus TaxID=10029 RepID=G3HI73_CRIGR|nr:hypothetical protein I79_010340 [Cricetulus griseus]
MMVLTCQRLESSVAHNWDYSRTMWGATLTPVTSITEPRLTGGRFYPPQLLSWSI